MMGRVSTLSAALLLGVSAASAHIRINPADSVAGGREKYTMRVWLALLLSLAAPLHAHHGPTLYDRSQSLEVTGVVREFRWTSPHAWIYVDVPAATGAAASTGQWAFEAASIAVMVRNGWKSVSLHPGDRVRISAAPRKDGVRGGELRSVILTDSGKVLRLGGI
jgi:hypothetical protein